MRRRKKEEAKEGHDDGEGLGIKNSSTYVRWLDGISRHIALIFVVILICFHNALDGDFVFDDTFAVRDNKDVTGESSSGVWTHDFWGQDIRKSDSHKSYRPITTLSFRANYLASGLWTPAFHATNVAIHFVVSCLLMVFCCQIGCTSSASLFASLLFAAHPVHTEAVTGIVGRSDLLCTLFFLLSCMAYVQGTPAARISSGQWLCALAVLLAIASCLCKETGATSFIVIIVIEIVRSKNWMQSLVAACCIASIGASLLVARRLLTVDVTLSNYRRIENPLTGLSGLPFAMSNAWVHVSYASLLLFPFHLSCDYSYDCVPLVTSASDPRNAASLAFFAAILAASIQAARACAVRARLHQPFAYGMALLFIPMLPASNVFFLVGTFVAERLLYLPSCGLCVLIAACMSQASKRGEGTRAGLTAKAAAAALVSAMAARTALRNRDWASEESLFASALEVCPRSAKVQLNSGILRRRKDDWGGAMRHFDRALEIEPDYCECKYWMGRTHLDMGNLETGSELLRDAISCKWVTAEAAEALFRVFQARINLPGSEKGHLYEEWADVLLEASSIVSSVSGVDGQQTGGSSAAAVHFGKAAQAYISEGDADSARRCYVKALGLSPGDCDFLLPLGEMDAEGVDERQLARCESKGKKQEQQLQGHTMEEHCRRASVLLAANDAAGAQPHIRAVGMMALGGGGTDAARKGLSCLAKLGGGKRTGDGCEADFWEGRLQAELAVEEKNLTRLREARRLLEASLSCPRSRDAAQAALKSIESAGQ